MRLRDESVILRLMERAEKLFALLSILGFKWCQEKY